MPPAPSRSSAASASAAGLVFLVAACGVPERMALPVPVPLTQGGTVVPASGGGGGIEFGDGFLGQELLRTETLTFTLFGGIGDRFGLTVASFTETRGNELSGSVLRAKGRIGPIAGPRSSASVAFAHAWSEREAGDVQDERVSTLDLSVPVEFLLGSSPNGNNEIGAYGGPRVVYQRYVDRLEPAETLEATHWGAIGGVHARLGFVHFFGELSALRYPARTVRGTALDGGVTIMPSLGIALHFGKPHRWSHPTGAR